MTPEEPLLLVEDLNVRFPGAQSPVEVVRGVSLELERGETVGLVGESGSGKTLTALALMGLVPAPGEVEAQRLELEGRSLLGLSEAELRTVRGARIAIVFQEPMTALHPVLTVGRQLSEVLRAHRPLTRAEAEKEAVRLLGLVAIAEPEARLRAYPHQLSGGQLQRILLAAALANDPALLIADEPTTALDVTVQAQILELMAHLQEELALAVLLITHDLAVVAQSCRRVCVMYSGHLVEQGAVEDVFSLPDHPYTEGLLSALPRVGAPAPRGELPTIPGQVVDPERRPEGCTFGPRCVHRFDACAQPPPWTRRGDERWARCHLPPAGSRA